MRSTEPNGLTVQSPVSTRSIVADAHGMRIEAERRPDEVVLAHITGEIDLLSAPELRKWVQEVGTRAGGLVLDFDDVGFLGSAGLSVLAELAEKSVLDQLNWAIVATSRVVLRPLEATGLVVQMPVYASVDAAIDAVVMGA
ncbi:anti-sigma factor antagonist [Saccharomonospora sp. NPDC046836]|uniref:anti-sigma factor antagonist n=1 Tax=Saccharomonospora sp. NPDC046836 TaxID=3156921 RepID=UPI0033CAC266